MTEERIMVYAIIFPSDINISENILYTNKNSMHMIGLGLAETVDAMNYVLQLPRTVDELDDIWQTNICSKIFLLPDSTSFEDIENLQVDGLFYTENAKEISPGLIMYKCKGSCFSHSLLVRRITDSDLCTDCLVQDWATLYIQTKLCVSEADFIKSYDIKYLNSKEIIALPALYLAKILGDYSSKVEEIQSQSKKLDNEEFELFCIGQFIQLYDAVQEKYNSTKKGLSAVVTYNELSPDIVNVYAGREPEGYSDKSQIKTPPEELEIIRLMGVREAILKNAIFIPICKESGMSGQNIYHVLQRSEFQQNGLVNSSCNYQGKNLIKDSELIKNKLSSTGEEAKEKLQILSKCCNIEFISQFPLGQLIITSDLFPLLTHASVTYNSIYPLYITYPQMFEGIPGGIIHNQCKIAFAECILKNDPVREESNRVKAFIESAKNKNSQITLIYEDNFKDSNELENFINANADADIIYISAHGRKLNYNRDLRSDKDEFIGIRVGTDNNVWEVSDKSHKLLKFIILSACNTSPRGINEDNIAETFINYYRATSVLSTMISIDAPRNSEYMIRFFRHLFEQMQNTNGYLTIAEIWREITVEAFVYDLMHASKKKFRPFMEANANGNAKRRIEDFLEKAYTFIVNNEQFDVISYLKGYIKTQCSNEKEIKQWDEAIEQILQSKSYFPEIYYYQLIGAADNIRVGNAGPKTQSL